MADSPNKVEVSKTNVGNDLVGRDKFELNVTLQNSSEKVFTYIKILNEKFLLERESNEKIDSHIDDLMRYTKAEGDVLGVENKLQDTDFEFYVTYALRAKDRFVKKLYKIEYFQSAQEIIVFLMAKIESNFIAFIYPKLLDSYNRDEILSLIKIHIVTPVLDELGTNVLGLNDVDIDGMLFFLTGNCHLNWK